MWDEKAAGALLVSMLTALEGGDGATYARLMREGISEPGTAFVVVDMLVKLYLGSISDRASDRGVPTSDLLKELGMELASAPPEQHEPSGD